MGTYFNSWRRILGTTALAVACVFAAGWIRSVSSFDMLRIPAGSSTCLLFYSGDGRFGATVFQGEWPPLKTPKWTTRQFSGSLTINSSEVPNGCASLSYWLKVIPLVVTSAYLLLFQPKLQNPNNWIHWDHTGTMRDYFEVCMVAVLILANLDIVTALTVALF